MKGSAVILLIGIAQIADGASARQGSLQRQVLERANDPSPTSASVDVDLREIDRRYSKLKDDHAVVNGVFRATRIGVELSVGIGSARNPVGSVVSRGLSELLAEVDDTIRRGQDREARRLFRFGYRRALESKASISSDPKEAIEQVFGRNGVVARLDGLEILDDDDPIRRQAKTNLLVEALKRAAANKFADLEAGQLEAVEELELSLERLDNLTEVHTEFAAGTIRALNSLGDGQAELAQKLGALEGQSRAQGERLDVVEDVLLGSLPPAQQLRALRAGMGTLNQAEREKLTAQLEVRVAIDHINAAVGEAAGIAEGVARLGSQLGLDPEVQEGLNRAATVGGLAQRALALYAQPSPAAALGLLADVFNLGGGNRPDPAADRHAELVERLQELAQGIDQLKRGQAEILANQRTILSSIEGLSKQLAASHREVIGRLDVLLDLAAAHYQLTTDYAYRSYNLCLSALDRRGEESYVGGMTMLLGSRRTKSVRVGGFYLRRPEVFGLSDPDLAGCRALSESPLYNEVQGRVSAIYLMPQTLRVPAEVPEASEIGRLRRRFEEMRSLARVLVDDKDAPRVGRRLRYPAVDVATLLAVPPTPEFTPDHFDAVWLRDEVAPRIVADAAIMFLESHVFWEQEWGTRFTRERLLGLEGLIGTAMAQQALASGDFAIPGILDAVQNRDADVSKAILAVAGGILEWNPVMAENLVLAGVHRSVLGSDASIAARVAALHGYAVAWHHRDPRRLASLLPSWMPPVRCADFQPESSEGPGRPWCVNLSAGPLAVGGSLVVALPTPAELSKGQLRLPNEMFELAKVRVLIQHRIAELNPIEFLGAEQADALVAAIAKGRLAGGDVSMEGGLGTNSTFETGI